MTTPDYNISAGHIHAMIDPSMLDNYTGPCEFVVAGPDGFQWYTGTLVGPASPPGECRWTIEHVGIALTRAASHIAIPIQTPEACADIAPPTNTCDPVEEIPSVDALRELEAVIAAQTKAERPDGRFTKELSERVVYLNRQWRDVYDRWKALPPLPPGESCPPYMWFESTPISVSVPQAMPTVDLMGQIQQNLSQRLSEDIEAAMLQEPPPAGSFRAWAPKGFEVLPVSTQAEAEPQRFPYMEHNHIRFRLR